MRFGIRIPAGCALLFLWVASRAAFGAVDANSGRIVVMISVDGLAAFYMDDPEAEMPNIRAIAQIGASASMMKASTPTVTWPNHTTLVTGDNPARHGVVGNNYFDRATGKNVALISDPVYDKDQIVKVSTIYDLAKEAGLRTASTRWPATRNAKSLDWTFPDVATNELLDQCTTPALLAECTKAGIWEEGQPQVDAENVRIVTDPTCTRVFKFILHEHRPNLALLHLINVDHTEHISGPRSPEAYAAIKQADEEVGEIWSELKDEYAGKATLLIVSDHGFSPIYKMVLPNIVLRDAGLAEVKGIRVVGGQVRLLLQGGCAMVYIRDESERATLVARIHQLFDGREGIDKVAGPDELKNDGVAAPADDPHAPDMILFAKEGYAFADTAAGSLSFSPTPNRKGTHGHDADLPHLHAMFAAWGEGIKPGIRLGEISNTDVAPTIARLLDIPMPGVDGKPLEEILVSPK